MNRGGRERRIAEKCAQGCRNHQELIEKQLSEP